MSTQNQVFGTGKLDNEVETEPLDKLTVSIGWADETPSSPLSLTSFGGENDEKYKIEIEIYLNEKGKKIVETLANLRDFGKDSQKALNKISLSLGLIGLSEILPDDKISKVLLILSLATLPFTRLKFFGEGVFCVRNLTFDL
jgi:hypothetical protein